VTTKTNEQDFDKGNKEGGLKQRKTKSLKRPTSKLMKKKRIQEAPKMNGLKPPTSQIKNNKNKMSLFFLTMDI